MSFKGKSIATITNVLNSMCNDGSLPPLPWGQVWIQSDWETQVDNQLTLDELKDLLSHLYHTFPVFQDTGSLLQVRTEGVSFPIVMVGTNAATQLLLSIKQPTMTAAQRAVVRLTITKLLKSTGTTPSSVVLRNLDSLLCSIQVTNNGLTKKNLQDLLVVVRLDSFAFTAKENFNYPILLGDRFKPRKDLENVLSAAISTTHTPSALFSTLFFSIPSNTVSSDPNIDVPNGKDKLDTDPANAKNKDNTTVNEASKPVPASDKPLRDNPKSASSTSLSQTSNPPSVLTDSVLKLVNTPSFNRLLERKDYKESPVYKEVKRQLLQEEQSLMNTLQSNQQIVERSLEQVSSLRGSIQQRQQQLESMTDICNTFLTDLKCCIILIHEK